MAIPHAQPGEVIDLRPRDLSIAGAKTETLVKTGSLEVIRIVMAAGKHIPPHSVPGEITVQCLEGHVEFHVGDSKHDLTAGKFLYLTGGDSHSLLAKTDSIVLVTILLAPKSSTTK